MKNSVSFHLVLVIVVAAALSAFNRKSVTELSSTSPKVASRLASSANELSQTAVQHRSGYSMGGWALGDPMPGELHTVEIQGVEIFGAHGDQIDQISGAPLRMNGKLILPATPTLEQCIQALGVPYNCGYNCCASLDQPEWHLGNFSMVFYRAEDQTLTLTRFPTYHELYFIDGR